MSGEVVNRVVSTTTGSRGRSLNNARTNHFVIDYAGPNAQATTPMEAFLSGISSCGVLIVEDVAHQKGVPLANATVTIESTRSADKVTINKVNIQFAFVGPSQEQAADLVDIYKSR